VGREWVHSYERDLGRIQPAGLWKAVKMWAREEVGAAATRPVQLVYVWASMDCTTFSPMDSMQSVSCRDHQGSSKAPSSSMKGRQAELADTCMKFLLLFLVWAVEEWQVEWGLENPCGSLARREYMQSDKLERMGLAHKMHTVNYCAWRHIYNKATNVWTSTGWEPEGFTGDGRCGGKCGLGMWINGSYRHFWTIGQESWGLARGEEQEELKILVPGAMHEEILSYVTEKVLSYFTEKI